MGVDFYLITTEITFFGINENVIEELFDQYYNNNLFSLILTLIYV